MKDICSLYTEKATVSYLILLRLNTEALIYRVNCQWNSLDRGAIIHRLRQAR